MFYDKYRDHCLSEVIYGREVEWESFFPLYAEELGIPLDVVVQYSGAENRRAEAARCVADRLVDARPEWYTGSSSSVERKILALIDGGAVDTVRELLELSRQVSDAFERAAVLQAAFGEVMDEDLSSTTAGETRKSRARTTAPAADAQR